MALHPAPVVPLADMGLSQEATVAVIPLAAEGQLDGLAEQERPQLLLGSDLCRPRAALDAGIDGARRQRPDQPQLRAVIKCCRLAVDYARDGARRAWLKASARRPGLVQRRCLPARCASGRGNADKQA